MKTPNLRIYIFRSAVALGLLLAVADAPALTKTPPDGTNSAPANAFAPAANALPTPPNLTPAAPVNSPASPTGEDIRDIRQPRHEPTLWPWFVIVAGVATLIAAVFAVRYWLHHGQFFEMSPGEIALQRLAEARRLMDPEQAREYCFAVSKIIRGYLEDQWYLHAPRLTTEEFLRELVEGRETIAAPQRGLLGDFLQHCDLAKFAGWRYSLEALANMHASAIEFVQQSAVTPAKATSTRTFTTSAGATTSTNPAARPIPQQSLAKRE